MGTNNDGWVIIRGTEDRDAAEVRDQLVAAGLNAELVVSVPAEQGEIASQILEGSQGDADPSAELDLETIAVFHGIDGEMQAAAVQSLLEDSGISAIIEGASVIPSLPFEIKVAKRLAATAREVIAKAEAEGPAAADAESAATGA